MQARSALFDLYGDYLRPRGGRAPVSALVRLLAPLEIAAPAVRTAVSRMVRQGWLHPLRLASGPGYLLSPKAARRLDEAAARIYRTRGYTWDGSFDLLVIDPPAHRGERARLTANMAFLGYGCLDDSAWIAPRRAEEVEALLTDCGVRYERFTANHAGGATGASSLVRRAWDLDAIATAYDRFVQQLRPIVCAVDDASAEEAAYAARFRLVHAWRTFLFQDPQLPPGLLPPAWPGTAAATFFDKHAARLRPAADRYVDTCLARSGRGLPAARTDSGPRPDGRPEHLLSTRAPRP
ncbi:MAG: PaaX family transcriptional regulator [Micromonosporaceae bacterium]|nr:PaaX family transcriptional regulator [Micromonosporaceae bacterium]